MKTTEGINQFSISVSVVPHLIVSFMSASATVPFGLSSMKASTISAGKWKHGVMTRDFPTNSV